MADKNSRAAGDDGAGRRTSGSGRTTKNHHNDDNPQTQVGVAPGGDA
jgi:hypothetical protein